MTKMESFVDPMAGGLVGILVDTAKKVGGNFAQVLGDRAKAYASLKHYANKYSACYGSLKLFGMQRSVPLETMAYILRREALQGNGSSPQEFQPILGLNFSRLKLYAETIYKKVRFLSGLSIRQFTSLEALEKSYRHDKKRRFQIHDSSKLDAPIVINETEFLQLLNNR